jgi:hypothetical protein
MEDTIPNSNFAIKKNIRRLFVEKAGGLAELVFIKDNARSEAIKSEMHLKAVKETGFGPNFSSPEVLQKRLFDESYK